MRHELRRFLTAATAALLTAGVGCSSMRPGSLARVAPVTQNDRVGSVYLFRGWIGVFSTGIDSLGKQLNDDGVHAEVFQQDQWSALADAMIATYAGRPDHEPIVLIGHSYGADDAILVLRKLAAHGITVDLVVTLDPVTPERVPGNVGLVYNLYQSSPLDALPFFRGIPLTPDVPGPVELRNMNVRTDRRELAAGGVDHFNIEKKPQIHADVIAQVLNVCRPRGEWVDPHPGSVDVAGGELRPDGLAITGARPRASLADAVTSIGDGR